MNSTSSKNEGWLYALALLVAVGFRFIQLGAAPLTDSEAALALQSWHLAQGQSVLLAPQPAYILFTSVFFKLIESTNFMARLLPALAGSVLVLLPLLFKRKLGTRAAILLAFLIAIDPGLTALSRQATGTTLALTCLLAACGFWMERRFMASGIGLALALLAGPSVWSGVLILFLTSIFLRGMRSSTGGSSGEGEQSETESQPAELFDSRSALRTLLGAFFVTFILAGTLFLTVPNGLSAALASLSTYLNGWVRPAATTTSRALFIFAAYEPLGISLAVLSLYRGFRTNSKRIVRLGLGLGVALLLAVFYRNPSELTWAILPLLALAAMELSRAFDLYREELTEVGVVVFASLLLLAYAWFNLAGLALNPAPVPATVPIFGIVQNPRYVVLFGALGILLVSFGLVAFGWSARTARLAATWTLTIFFSVYAMGAAWGASGLRNPGGVELWLPDPRPQQAELLKATVNDVSEFSVGNISAQPVTLLGFSSPALEWLLRLNGVTVVEALDPQQAPPMVITSASVSDLGLPSAYRGQDFIWRQQPQWAVTQNYDWINWLVFRKLPVETETVILWARNDLFPDARGTTQP